MNIDTVPRQLLVVERDRRVGSYISQALRAEGYQVVWATCDDEALACVRRESPEVIVLDATRPDHGATTLAQALHAARPAVPILMVTTGAGPDDALMADLAAGRLIKPFRLDDLLAQVTALLAR